MRTESPAFAQNLRIKVAERAEPPVFVGGISSAQSLATVTGRGVGRVCNLQWVRRVWQVVQTNTRQRRDQVRRCRKTKIKALLEKNKMKSMIKPIVLAGITASALFLGTTNSMAQRQGGGNFDPAQFRERMMEGYQELFAMSADEFKAVRPLIEAVMTKQQELQGFSGRGGFPGFGRGGRGGGGPGGDPGQGDGRGRGLFGTPAPELEALQKAVESGTPEEIKAKLKAFREARAKKEAELQNAQKKLVEVLGVKQEANAAARGLVK